MAWARLSSSPSADCADATRLRSAWFSMESGPRTWRGGQNNKAPVGFDASWLQLGRHDWPIYWSSGCADVETRLRGSLPRRPSSPLSNCRLTRGDKPGPGSGEPGVKARPPWYIVDCPNSVLHPTAVRFAPRPGHVVPGRVVSCLRSSYLICMHMADIPSRPTLICRPERVDSCPRGWLSSCAPSIKVLARPLADASGREHLKGRRCSRARVLTPFNRLQTSSLGFDPINCSGRCEHYLVPSLQPWLLRTGNFTRRALPPPLTGTASSPVRRQRTSMTNPSHNRPNSNAAPAAPAPPTAT